MNKVTRNINNLMDGVEYKRKQALLILSQNKPLSYDDVNECIRLLINIKEDRSIAKYLENFVFDVKEDES